MTTRHWSTTGLLGPVEAVVEVDGEEGEEVRVRFTEPDEVEE